MYVEGVKLLTRQSFLHGALVLAAAGFISKILGVLYRIPFARLVGAEGMGLYQMAYPIYTMVLAVATAGFPVAISVLISEKKAQGDQPGLQKVFRIALLLLSSMSLIMAWLLFSSARFLADNVLHDHRAVYSLVFISPAIFFAGTMSVFRGYFQGQQWMWPTALSQVLEQTVRVGTVLLGAWWLLPRGLEFAAAGATFGAVTGGLAGLLVLLIIYFRYQPVPSSMVPSFRSANEGTFSLLKRLVTLAFPIALGALVLPFVQTLDAFMVPQRLQQAGYTMSEATELFGQLSGMAGTLINLPGVITIALATSLVPAISGAAVQQQWETVRRRLTIAIRVVGMVSLPAAAGLYILAIPISDLLYGVPEAGLPLKAMAPAVFFLGLYQVTSGVLQGLGKTIVPVRHLILASILKVGLNYLLVVQPAFGIQGAGIATGVTFAVAAGLNLLSLRRLLGYNPPWVLILLKPGLAVTIMAVFVNLTYERWQIALGSGHLATVLVVLLAGIIYGLGILLSGGLKRRDLEMIPGLGTKLAYWLQYFKLIRG